MNDKITNALKEISEETLTQVQAKLKEKGIELAVANDGTVVPADKHDSLKAELTAEKAVVTKLQGIADKVSVFETDNADLKQKLLDAKTEGETAITQAKADAEKIVKDTYINSELRLSLLAEGAAPEYVDLLVPLFDREKMTLTDDKKILGSKELIAPIKDQRAGLFTKVAVDGVPPVDGKAQPTDTDNLSDADYYAALDKQEK